MLSRMGKLLDNKLFGFLLVCTVSCLACSRCAQAQQRDSDGYLKYRRDDPLDQSLHAKFKKPENLGLSSALKREKELLSRINVLSVNKEESVKAESIWPTDEHAWKEPSATVCSQLTCPDYECPDDSCRVRCDCPPIVECKPNATEGFCTCDQLACPKCRCPKPKCPPCPCKRDGVSCPKIECPACPDGARSACPGGGAGGISRLKDGQCGKPECNADCRMPQKCNCPRSESCGRVQRCLHCPATMCPKCAPCPDFYCSPCDCVSGGNQEDRDPCVKAQGCPPCEPHADLRLAMADPRNKNAKSPVIVNFEFYPVGKGAGPAPELKAIRGQEKRWVAPSPAESLPDTVPFFEEELSPTEGRTQHVLMAGYIVTLLMMLLFGAGIITQNYMMDECLTVFDDRGDEEEPCL